MILLLFLSISFARESLIKKEPPKAPVSTSRKAQLRSAAAAGNLPSYFFVSSSFSSEGSPIILPTVKTRRVLSDLRLGDVIEAEILESVIAYPDSKVPVRAVVPSGRLRGVVLMGLASLEKNSKRINIEFTKVRKGSEVYELKAFALDESGTLGLEGEYHSDEPKWFMAEFLSAGAAGAVAASVNRERTPFGTVEERSVDSVAKNALGSALMKTAEHYGEKVKGSPEYSVVTGPLRARVLVVE